MIARRVTVGVLVLGATASPAGPVRAQEVSAQPAPAPAVEAAPWRLGAWRVQSAQESSTGRVMARAQVGAHRWVASSQRVERSPEAFTLRAAARVVGPDWVLMGEAITIHKQADHWVATVEQGSSASLFLLSTQQELAAQAASADLHENRVTMSRMRAPSARMAETEAMP